MAKYKAYPEYKDSGVEWLGAIPDHWKVRRIKETADVISGFPFSSLLFHPTEGFPLVRIRDINSKRTEVFFNGFVPDDAKINSGDILIGMDGDFNVSWWESGEAALNQRVACIRPNSDDLAKFIFYFLPFNMKMVNDLTYFTTVKHLSNVDILKTTFAHPSDNEISSIVCFLDHETAKIDNLIEKQQQLIELLKEKRQAVISHAVTKGLNPDVPMKDSGVEWLGEVPEHWAVIRLKYLINTFEQGWSPQCDARLAEGNEYGVLKVGCVNSGKFNPLEHKALPSNLEPQRQYLLKKNDLLISRANTKELVGSSAVVDKNYDRLILCDKLYRIKFSTSVNPHFISEYMRTPLVRKQIELSASGASHSMQNIGQDTIKELAIALPPEKESRLLVEFIQREINIFSALTDLSHQQVALLQERRTALISAAVTGKIDVRDWIAPDTSDIEATEEATV